MAGLRHPWDPDSDARGKGSVLVRKGRAGVRTVRAGLGLAVLLLPGGLLLLGLLVLALLRLRPSPTTTAA
jgi:hypothetical protein